MSSQCGVKFLAKYCVSKSGTLTNAPPCADARKAAVASSSSSRGSRRGRTRVQWGLERMDRGHPLFVLWQTWESYLRYLELYLTHPLTIGIKLIPSSTSNLLIILSLCIPFVVPPCLIFILRLYADSSIVLPFRSPHFWQWLEVGENETMLCKVVHQILTWWSSLYPFNECHSSFYLSCGQNIPRGIAAGGILLTPDNPYIYDASNQEVVKNATKENSAWAISNLLLRTELECFNSCLKQNQMSPIPRPSI